MHGACVPKTVLLWNALRTTHSSSSICSYGRIQVARILSNLHERCLRNLLFSEAANGSICVFFLLCVFCLVPTLAAQRE